MHFGLTTKNFQKIVDDYDHGEDYGGRKYFTKKKYFDVFNAW